MSTKNLGRSALEGGRYGRYKARVAEIEASFRTANRDFVKGLELDPENDNYDVPVIHPKSKRGNQTDKLSGMYRLLDSLVGRPWDKVRSEITSKFDARTLAGRHVLYCHLFREIALHEHVEHGYGGPNGGKSSDYYVDDQGIFRKRRNRRRHYYKTPHAISRESFHQVANWLGGRGIIRAGSKFYWGIPNCPIQVRPDWYNLPVYEKVDKTWPWSKPMAWRQERELKGSDLELVKSFHAALLKAVLVRDDQAEKEAA